MTGRFAGLAVILAVAAGCGDGSGPSTEEQEALRVVVDVELTRDEQDCVLAGLAANEVTPADVVGGRLTAEQDTAMLAVTLECVDDLSEVPSFVDAFIAGAADEGVTLSTAEARCAIEAAGGEDQAADIAACLDTGADAGSGDYGDDPILDLLWDSCASGNNQACDELAITSPIDSGYETFARECGGRRDTPADRGCFDDFG